MSQLNLPLPRPKKQVDPSLVHQQRSLLAAIKLCVSAGGFESDKEVYLSLEIDAGHWSRILRGDAHFPVNKLGELMDLCGNEAPLEWLAHTRGYELCPLESEIERENRELREELERVRLREAVLKEVIEGRR